MKNIFIVIIAIVAFGGLIWLGRPDASQSPSTAQAQTGALTVVGESTYDFGSISMKNGRVNRMFEIVNDSSAPVTLQKIYTSCMCTTATLSFGGKSWGPVGMPGHGGVPPVNESLSPGEKATILVEFDPNAHGPAGVGRIAREIIIENDAGAPMRLSFSAMVTP